MVKTATSQNGDSGN